MRKRLILGSSSPYRHELLQRLGLPFEAFSPEIDETHLDHETPEELVKRLALEKAQAVAELQTGAWIIGSDQVCVIQGKIVGKPGNKDRANEQLRAARGKKVSFLTGLCLLDADTGEYQLDLVPYTVSFLDLSDAQIKNYVDREQPLNCAGSFKSEGLGVALFEKMQGDDPTALIGLPLIRLIEMLRRVEIDVLG